MSEDREDSRIGNEANLREDGEAWIPVREAAAVLGISVRAVQLQAQAGKIASRREGKRLLVNLAPDQAPVISARPVRESGEVREANREVREDSHLLQQLRGEVAFLRSELTAAREGRDKSEGEWRLILAAKEQTEQDLRRQLSALEKQLAIAPGPEPTKDSLADREPEPRSAGDKQGERVETGQTASQEPQRDDLAPLATDRPWWKFWGRKD